MAGAKRVSDSERIEGWMLRFWFPNFSSLHARKLGIVTLAALNMPSAALL
jgi:hypothetical protein